MSVKDNLTNESRSNNSVHSLSSLIEASIKQKYENKSNNPSDLYGYSYSVNSNEKLESNFESEKSQIEINKDMRKIMFCKDCKEPFSIRFMDNLDLSLDCGCRFVENYTTEEYGKEYYRKIKNNDIFKENPIHCIKHPKLTKLIYYCIDCEYDLCEECTKKESYLYSNTQKHNKLHENHGLVKLNKNFDYIYNLLQESKKFVESKNYCKEKNCKINNIFSLIEVLLTLYPKYNCSQFYKSLRSGEEILKKIKENFKFDKHKGTQTFYKITAMNQLNKINDFEKIIGIYIKKSEHPFNLSIFENKENKNFLYLKELVLIGDDKVNKIKDISPLFKCEFPVLERLNLINHEIDNTIIEKLKEKNLPELNYLSLYVNKITSVEIFDVIQKFTKLIKFHIGENKFQINKDDNKFYKMPESLEELGLTGNFNEENAAFIQQLGIDNLIKLYFSRNKLTNLKYLQTIKFKRIKILWVISNDITDIKEIKNIQGKEHLEILNLKENKINNFNELFDVIGSFPSLKKLILIENNINENEVKEMKRKIKENYSRDLDIIITKETFYNIYDI